MRAVRAGAVFPVVALLLAIVLFRGSQWFSPVSDPTIGLYVYGGRAWLDGHLPYSTFWDYRPPGLFALYAVTIHLFGSTLAPNVLTTGALIATTVALALLAVRFDPLHASSSGWWAALFFVLLAPVNDGSFGAAEVEISAFIAWSLWFATNEGHWFDAVIAGLLGSCAVLCKLSAAFLIVPPLLALAYTKNKRATAAGKLLGFTVGFAIPITAVAVLYMRAGQFAALVDANIWASFRRLRSADNFYAYNLKLLPLQLVRLAPALELALFAIGKSANRSRLMTWGWFAAGLCAIVAPMEFFPRQLVVLTAPTALLGALGTAEITRRLHWGSRALVAATAVLILVTFAFHDYRETVQTSQFIQHRLFLHQSDWHPDNFSIAYRAIQSTAGTDRSLFLIEQSPYLYDALKAVSPTRFPYTDTLLDSRLSQTAGVDGYAELARIFDTEPHTVVVSALDDRRWDPRRVRLIRSELANRYRRAFDRFGVQVFRLRLDRR
jgi:hypothetical protein